MPRPDERGPARADRRPRGIASGAELLIKRIGPRPRPPLVPQQPHAQLAAVGTSLGTRPGGAYERPRALSLYYAHHSHRSKSSALDSSPVATGPGHAPMYHDPYDWLFVTPSVYKYLVWRA